MGSSDIFADNETTLFRQSGSSLTVFFYAVKSAEIKFTWADYFALWTILSKSSLQSLEHIPPLL